MSLKQGGRAEGRQTVFEVQDRPGLGNQLNRALGYGEAKIDHTRHHITQ